MDFPSKTKIRACLVLSLLFALSLVAQAKNAKELPGADIFDATNIIRIAIQIPSSGMDRLSGTHWREDSERPEVRATVSDGKHTYTNVALHLKGSAGSFQSIEQKPAMTLNFDKYAKGQTFHGLQKFSLNNSRQDRSYICEKISRELFEKAGVPAPRADYAIVTINGRAVGLYVLVEAYNKQFLKRHFPDVSGNLYDGGFCTDLNSGMEVTSGEKPADHSALRKAISAATSVIRQPGPLEEFGKAVDLDRLISMMVMEVLACHWDGYSLKPNNYRIFHDVSTGRMVLMPHGMDQMFGRGGHIGTSFPMMPNNFGGMLARAVYRTPEGREKYLKRFGEIVTNVFNAEDVAKRVREIGARLQPVLSPNRAADHQMEAEYLAQNILERGRVLQQFLDPSLRALVFKNGVAPLPKGWRSIPRRPGALAMMNNEDPAKPQLYLKVDRDGGAAVMRTTVTVKKGIYKLEGLGKVSGGNDTEAFLRVIDAEPEQVLNGKNRNWTRAAFPFEVVDDLVDVTLTCELRGKGEAWFDASSLMLREVTQ